MMTEALISTEYPFCEPGLAMVIVGLTDEADYKDIRISIDRLNFIKASIDDEYPYRTKPILFGKLDITKVYEVIAKISRASGTVDQITSKYQPICGEALYPQPIGYSPVYPSGCILEGEVVLCTEQ